MAGPPSFPTIVIMTICFAVRMRTPPFYKLHTVGMSPVGLTQSPDPTPHCPQSASFLTAHSSGTSCPQPQHLEAPARSCFAPRSQAHLFVVMHDAQSGEHPGAGGGDDVAVSKADPLHHLGGGLGRAAPQLLVAHCRGSTKTTAVQAHQHPPGLPGTPPRPLPHSPLQSLPLPCPVTIP